MRGVEPKDKKHKTQTLHNKSAIMQIMVKLVGIVMVIGDRGVVAQGTEKWSNVLGIYMMGDSSVDCGENTVFYPFLHQNLSLLPCNGNDATLLPHFLAEKIGLPYIRPFYSQSGSLEGLLNGLNFGSAQATIINPTTTQTYQSLNQQLRQVLEAIQLIQLQLPQDQSIHLIKSSIFYLSFGKNDYIDLYLQNSSSGLMLKYNKQEFAKILVNQMMLVLRNLYDANARKIVCAGILPLGCSPHALFEWSNSSAAEFDERGCVKMLNELVLEFNKRLDELIVELNDELPDAQIIFCDVYKGIIEIVTNPSRYRFEESKRACCGIGLYDAMIGCVSIEMACNQSSAYVWWDLYNPTPTVNSLLADSAWSDQPFSSLCHPFTIQQLATTGY